MRLEVMLLPYPLNSHSTDTLGFGHASHAPVGRIQRGRMKCCVDHSINFPFWDFGNTTWTRSILFQTIQPKRQKTLPPKLYRRARNPQSASDLLAMYTVCRHPDDFSPRYQPCGNTSSSRPRFQSRTLFRKQYDKLCCSAHKQHYTRDLIISQVICGTLH